MPTYGTRHISVDLNSDEEEEEEEEREGRNNDNNNVHIDTNCDFRAWEQHVPFPPED